MPVSLYHVKSYSYVSSIVIFEFSCRSYMPDCRRRFSADKREFGIGPIPIFVEEENMHNNAFVLTRHYYISSGTACRVVVRHSDAASVMSLLICNDYALY